MALWPDRPTREALAGLPLPELAGVHRTAPANLHVTVRYLGSLLCPPGEVIAALESVEPKSSVRVQIGPSTARFANRVLYLPVDGVDEFATSCDQALANAGIAPRDSPFRGHITIARAKRTTPPETMDGLVGSPFHAGFTARTFTLTSSTISHSGPAYESVAIFGIGGTGESKLAPTEQEPSGDDVAHQSHRTLR